MTILQTLRHRWWVVLLCAAVGLGAGAAAAAVLPRAYESTTQLYVSLAPTASASDVLNSSTFVEQRAQTYAELVQGEAFERTVAQQVGVTETPELSAQLSDNTVLLVVTARATSGALAQREADAAAGLLIQRATQLEARADGSATLQLQVVEGAGVPEPATFPSPLALTVLGLVVGGGIGVTALVAASRMDSRLRRPTDVAALDVADSTTWLASDRRAGVEGGRALVAVHRQLVGTGGGGDGRTVVVAGCGPDDALTARRVADETAGALTRAGLSVALVQLDGAPSGVHAGLSDLIEHDAPPSVVGVPRADAVRVVSPGSQPLRVWSATGTEVESALHALQREVDTVLVLTPPAVTDQPFPATAYVRAAGAVLLVGTQRVASRRDVEDAARAVARWGSQRVHVLLARQGAGGGQHQRQVREAVVGS